MAQNDTHWIDAFQARFPHADRVALAGTGGAASRIAAALATAHDLTASEALEVVADWQAGLAGPAPVSTRQAA